MSHSKSVYGATSRKDTARTRRERHDNGSEISSVDKTVPEPACRSRSVGHSIDQREWRETAYEEQILAFHNPCSWPECYPDGPPDVTETETIVRSRHRPTVFHRPRQPPQNTAQAEQSPNDREAVTTIIGLQEGDSVLWNGQSTPLVVIGTTNDPTGNVPLKGPDGGSYRIEGRPNKRRPFAVYPAIGIIRDVRRIPVAADQPEPV